MIPSCSFLAPMVWSRVGKYALFLVTLGNALGASTVQPSAPAVQGDKIIFPHNAPQVASLTVAIAQEHIHTLARFSGRLVWNEERTVRVYTPVSGRVRRVNVNAGDHVQQDEVLAELDSPDFGQAQADARKASSDMKLAERSLDRTRDLFEHGAVARKEVEVAENTFADAQAERDRASAKLNLYGQTASFPGTQVFSLRTPLAGVIVEKNINSGQELRSDLMLANAPQLLAAQFVISDPVHLWVLLDVAESEMALIKGGQNLKIIARAYPEKAFTGRVESLSASLDPITRTVKVRGTVENNDLLLKAEMYVLVELDSHESQNSGTAEVPNSAVLLKDKQAYVFVESSVGAYERHEVKTSAEVDGRIIVTSGLQVGQRVVVQGALLLEQFLESGGRS